MESPGVSEEVGGERRLISNWADGVMSLLSFQLDLT